MALKLGNRIHELRKLKNMTLEELSEKSGVALATLSRMENNKMPGTLNSHQKICKALGASLAELYRELEDETKTVENVPQNERTEHFISANNTKYELLVLKSLDKKIMPLMIKIGPGGTTQEERNKQGVEKFVYLIKGHLEISVGEKTYALSPGDSLYFEASLLHKFSNNSKLDTEAICIVSPPAL
ncbi:MAG: cupin domain-containing protein [Candidatus Omnitrophota bacterium]|nr:cupin domain-containing protein [Candidatus Omnitrophota bacterium]